MAFKDLTVVLYDGKIKLDYKDKAHRYYVRQRINFDLPEDDPKAWGKVIYPKGTTTLLGDTLEKKGLMQWPKGVALAELFGFYDFVNENGEAMIGFSKGKGTMWPFMDQLEMGSVSVAEDLKEKLLPIIKSAADNWKRRQKKGADIGSVVHDAIEHYIQGEKFDIAEQYMWGIKEAFPIPEQGAPDPFEADRNLALKEFKSDVEKAMLAYNEAIKWWKEQEPELYGAEQIIYSMDYNVCGTYDMHIGIKRENHPIFKNADGPRHTDGTLKKYIRITGDWKTSNASKSEAAGMPEGINYQYFIQDAIYEMIRREMGMEPADDLLVVSVRKDGGFTPLYASELGLTVDECINWAKAVILCHRMMDKTKKGLVAHAEEVSV